MLLVSNSPNGYTTINVGIFKDSFLLGTFPLPPPNVGVVDPINMISYVVSLSLGSYDP